MQWNRKLYKFLLQSGSIWQKPEPIHATTTAFLTLAVLVNSVKHFYPLVSGVKLCILLKLWFAIVIAVNYVMTSLVIFYAQAFKNLFDAVFGRCRR